MEDVGKRLKEIRKQVGLSQRELAKRAGVTNSTISMIEKNNVSPSISSLKRVLAGIPMSLMDFFNSGDFESNAVQVVYRADEFQESSPDEQLRWKLIGKYYPNRQLSFMHETYPPGTDTGEDAYTHAGEEAGFIVSGKIELIVDGQTYVVSAGEGYYFESKRPHRFRNPFDEPCVMVSATTPADL